MNVYVSGEHRNSLLLGVYGMLSLMVAIFVQNISEVGNLFGVPMKVFHSDSIHLTGW